MQNSNITLYRKDSRHAQPLVFRYRRRHDLRLSYIHNYVRTAVLLHKNRGQRKLLIQQVKARRKGRKRPPLGLLVIAKLTLPSYF